MIFFKINCVKAQSDALTSHYILNQLLFNPAAIKKSNATEVFLLSRWQWVNFNGAPRTQNFNISTFIPKYSSGIGLVILNDKLGLQHNLQLRINYAYVLRLSKKQNVNFGVYTGLINRTLSNKLRLDNNTDNIAYSFVGTFNTLDLGLGMEYVTTKSKVGISFTHVEKSFKKADYYYNPRHMWIYGSYVINANEKSQIIPSYHLKSDFNKTQHEVSLNVVSNGEVRFGVSYRTSNDLIFLVGFSAGNKLKIGYSYDFNMGAVKRASSGSHEIFLGYSIKNKGKLHKTKRDVARCWDKF